MVTSRSITEQDRESVEQALSRDFFHPDTDANVFFEKGTMTNVYEDEQGPVLLVRTYKSLHLDLMCFDNADVVRNKAVLQEGWPLLVSGAQRNGFKEIVTTVNGPALLKFLTKKVEDGGFGFEEVNVDGEVSLRRSI